MKQINFKQISIDWNADPVDPGINLQINGNDLEMDISLNHYQFKQFKEGHKINIRFKNCAEYSLNTCNDEGYYSRTI